MNKFEQIAKLESTLVNLRRRTLRRGFGHADDLPYSLYQVMHTIIEHFRNSEEPISMSDIAKTMDVTLSAVSQAVDVLERKKVVKRARSLTDKRIVNIELTKKGKMMIKMFIKHHKENFSSGLIDHLGEKDTEELLRLMDRIIEYFNQSEGCKK